MESEKERIERIVRQLGVLSDIANGAARAGRVERVRVVAKRIYNEAYRGYVALGGEGEMGEFFLDWANDYECGGPIYSKLLEIAGSNSWKRG